MTIARVPRLPLRPVFGAQVEKSPFSESESALLVRSRRRGALGSALIYSICSPSLRNSCQVARWELLLFNILVAINRVQLVVAACSGGLRND